MPPALHALLDVLNKAGYKNRFQSVVLAVPELAEFAAVLDKVGGPKKGLARFDSPQRDVVQLAETVWLCCRHMLDVAQAVGTYYPNVGILNPVATTEKTASVVRFAADPNPAVIGVPELLAVSTTLGIAEGVASNH